MASLRIKTSKPATSRAKLEVFTWNLQGNIAALELACKHLSTLKSAIASLQELPSGFSPEMVRAMAPNLKVLTRPVRAPGSPGTTKEPKIALVSSPDIEIDPTGARHEYDPAFDSERRLEGHTLVAETWTNLQVLGLHAVDRRSRPTPDDRSDWATLLRGVVSKFWKGGPLVVLGDLNANPWDREVMSRNGLFAIRAKDWPRRNSHVKLPGREQYVQPLFNAMWHLLPDGKDHPGTYFYDDGNLRWHCFDQIVVSTDLRDHLMPPVVLVSLAGHTLVDRRGIPRRKKQVDGRPIPMFSDHLPVQMTLDLSKVESCRVSTSS